MVVSVGMALASTAVGAVTGSTLAFGAVFGAAAGTFA